MLPNFMMQLQAQLPYTKTQNTTNVNFLKIFISKFKSFIATNFHINCSYFLWPKHDFQSSFKHKLTRTYVDKPIFEMVCCMSASSHIILTFNAET